MSRDDVETIHNVMIQIGGGSYGLRDAALLESALARPQNLNAYGEVDYFRLAASYAEGIARNHPFLDGNKRTAFATADFFLMLNGYHLDQAKAHEHAELMEAFGQGHISGADVAEHFRRYSRPLRT
ncbi:type II toxin-antitoxin system death-on-curing family toxin [Halovulum sp. GXIMD14793]